MTFDPEEEEEEEEAEEEVKEEEDSNTEYPPLRAETEWGADDARTHSCG